MQAEYESDLEGLRALASLVLDRAGSAKLFGLEGSLGAGKTTFISHLAKALGVNDVVQSPTYGIANEYADNSGLPVYHLDLYRIASLHEALDAGVEEYIYSDSYCFVEWPDRIERLWPDNAVKIEIESVGEKRIFRVRYPK